MPYNFNTYSEFEQWEDEMRKKDEEAVRRVMNRQRPGLPARKALWFLFKIVAVTIVVWFFVIAAFSAPAKADTINQVAQEIKQESPLPLRQNVASFWASNLLTAQGDPSCTYCGAESLDLSIASVLRAIGLEQTIAGLSWCNLTNCIIANAQSTVAIDPNAGIGLSATAIYFGEVNVVTPEPTLPELLFIGTALLWLGLIFTGAKPNTREFASQSHLQRK